MGMANAAWVLYHHRIEAQHELRVVVSNLFENAKFPFPRFCGWHQIGHLKIPRWTP